MKLKIGAWKKSQLMENKNRKKDEERLNCTKKYITIKNKQKKHQQKWYNESVECLYLEETKKFFSLLIVNNFSAKCHLSLSLDIDLQSNRRERCHV